jgi:hypothetical protein
VGFRESPQNGATDDNHIVEKKTRPLPAAFQK